MRARPVGHCNNTPVWPPGRKREGNVRQGFALQGHIHGPQLVSFLLNKRSFVQTLSARRSFKLVFLRLLRNSVLVGRGARRGGAQQYVKPVAGSKHGSPG